MARVIEELDRLALSQAEIKAIVSNSMQFLASLEFTLREALPQEKLAALRQCIYRIHINKPANQIKLSARIIPSSSLQTGVLVSIGLRELVVDEPTRLISVDKHAIV